MACSCCYKRSSYLNPRPPGSKAGALGAMQQGRPILFKQLIPYEMHPLREEKMGGKERKGKEKEKKRKGKRKGDKTVTLI